MTQIDKEILDKQSNQTLCDWYCKINSSKLVNELPDADSINYTNPKPISK